MPPTPARVTQLRTNILAALAALPALSAWEIKPSSSRDASFRRISKRKGVFLIYAGFMPEGNQFAGNQQPNGTRRVAGRDTWFASILSESYRSLEETFSRADGLDAALDAVMSVNGLDVSDSLHTGQVKLKFSGCELVEWTNEAEGGGTSGYVVTFTTSVYMV